MVRFLHTSDWQLGMTRHFLVEGAQERYGQARFDAIRAMGRIAKEQRYQFMLVCGDVFESNQVERKTVARALEALKDVSVPVFILPGNHDPLNAAAVYRSSIFNDRKPPHRWIYRTNDALPMSGLPNAKRSPAAGCCASELNPPGNDEWVSLEVYVHKAPARE